MQPAPQPRPGLDSVYFGGGSPSLLTAASVGLSWTAAASSFRLATHAEITLEANPEDLSAIAVGRVPPRRRQPPEHRHPIFPGKRPAFLKRNHSAAQALNAVAMAQDAGFANLSIDLIIGLETQTAKSMELNFHAVEKLKPAHVSVYILEGVPRPENDDHDARLYFQARQNLLGLGYEHYEVSNYLPARQSLAPQPEILAKPALCRPRPIGRRFSGRPGITAIVLT